MKMMRSGLGEGPMEAFGKGLWALRSYYRTGSFGPCDGLHEDYGLNGSLHLYLI
jgi:hypothetical protein